MHVAASWLRCCANASQCMAVNHLPVQVVHWPICLSKLCTDLTHKHVQIDIIIMHYSSNVVSHGYMEAWSGDQWHCGLDWLVGLESPLTLLAITDKDVDDGWLDESCCVGSTNYYYVTIIGWFWLRWFSRLWLTAATWAVTCFNWKWIGIAGGTGPSR